MNRFFFPLFLPVLPLLAGCEAGGLLAETQAHALVVRPVIAQAVIPLQTDHLQMVGTIAPRTTTQMGFTVMGRLLSREVEIGDLVATGDVLARIDPTSLDLAVEAALADLRMAEAQRDNAQGALARQTVLHQGNVISDAVLELSRLQHRTAQARLESAAANLAAVRDQRADAVLVAGFDGVVTAIGGEVGEVVTPGLPVVTLARPGLRDAVIDIPEVLVPSIGLGDEWVVLLELAPDIMATGTVREISPQADPSTRTHRVRLALSDALAAFRFGTTVFARPAESGGRLLFVLPATALAGDVAQAQVWVVDPDKGQVSLRAVEAEAGTDGTIVIGEGLEEGEIVVTAGAASLAEGQFVKFDRDSQQ